MWLNMIKILAVVGVASLAVYRTFIGSPGDLWRGMFPAMSVVLERLGIAGLLTNIAFNLSWQFVDNSSWQSIISGSRNPRFSTRVNMRASGLVIFFTIGVLGTLLGASHAGVGSATPDNILIVSVLGVDGGGLFLSVAMIMVIVACMMSLVDGMLLASALTVVVDILPTWAGVSQARRKLVTHATVVGSAVASVWGIALLFRVWGGSLFDFVYIVIVTQLALLGPVVVGLFSRVNSAAPMWLAVVVGLSAGFGAVLIGSAFERPGLVDGAGSFAIVGSMVGAWAIWRWRREGLSPISSGAEG